MSKITLALASAVVALSLGTTPLLAADTPGAAKEVFLKHKCNECHVMKSQEIALAGKKPEGKPPEDLGTVGAKRSETWIKNFLLKKEAIDGQKHKKKFPGTPAELDEVAAWLGAMH